MPSWIAGDRSTDAEREEKRLGLRENLGQFLLLLLINSFVGSMVGMERSILPLLAEREFGIASRAAILSFLITFGIVPTHGNTALGYVQRGEPVALKGEKPGASGAYRVHAFKEKPDRPTADRYVGRIVLGSVALLKAIGALFSKTEGGVFDPLGFIVVPLALFAVTMLACYIPARWAGRVDPAVVLRNE